MRTIAVNQSLMYKRKYKELELNDRMCEEHEEAYAFESVEYGTSDELEFLLKIIKELPDTQRTVFNLRAIDGYSAKEVCEKLDMHITACKSNYSRAKIKLQNKIKQQCQNKEK